MSFVSHIAEEIARHESEHDRDTSPAPARRVDPLPSRRPPAKDYMRRAVEKTIPKSVNIAVLMREGFHQCRACGCCETALEEGLFLRCKRCFGSNLKFVSGIDS